MNTSRRRTWEVIIGITVLVIFSIIYISVLNAYDVENQTRNQAFSKSEGINPNHIAIDAKLISVDPIGGTVQARLQFSPQGDLLADDNVSLNKTLWLDVNADLGRAEYEFKRGDKMNPITVTYSLYGGNANYYPFDHHNALMHFDLSTPVIKGKMPTTEEIVDGKAPLPEYDQVPITIDFKGSLAGYSVSVEELSENITGYADLTIMFTRSVTVISFACFIMLLKWLLAMTTLFMMLAVTVRGRRVELSMFTWMAALLFALPPLRNSMPDVPPIGSLPDFVAFFWVEGIVAISLICVVFTWLKRPPHKNRNRDELKEITSSDEM